MGLLMSLLMFGAAYAQESTPPEALPEPNYMGIIIFLVVMIGGGLWFMWKVMRNKGDGKE